MSPPWAGLAHVPLVDRAMESVLFCRPAGDVTAAGFLADVQRVAAALPDGAAAVNLCRDRYAFVVAFAACLLRGHVGLLTSDCRPARLRDLHARFDGLYVVADWVVADWVVADGVVADGVVAGPHHDIGALPGIGVGPNPAIPAGQVAAVVFTSGSTGEPVGHRKTWGELAGRSWDAGQQFGLTDDAPAAIAGTVPPNHMYGFETTVLLPLHAPASSWCGPAFYPSDVADALATLAEPRMLVTTPHQIRTLLRADMTWPAVAAIVSATAPLDPAQARAAEARWGTPVHEIFGATEVGSIASRRTTDGDAWTLYPRTRMDMAAGTAWVETGGNRTALDDHVELLGSRQFRLLGRPSDLVKLAGRRASLAGLNHALNQIDGVLDGVFVVPPDLGKRAGARMLAFAVAPGFAPDELLAALRARIDPVFLPRRVVVVDRLPRNDVGKLSRSALIALAS